MTDPRFDPAFQRGYSGPQPELVTRATPAGQVVTPDAAAARDPADPDLADPLTPEPTPESESAPRPLNRPRLALLLFGLALLLAAAATLYEQVLHPQGLSTTIESQFVQVLTYNLPPGLALAGFVSLIVWLALGALDRDAAFDRE